MVSKLSINQVSTIPRFLSGHPSRIRCSLPPHIYHVSLAVAAPDHLNRRQTHCPRSQLTFMSIQALNCCSNAKQPSALCPLEAQQPSTEDMIPMQGFASRSTGLRTLRCGRLGNRGARLILGPEGFGGIAGRFRLSEGVHAYADTGVFGPE